MIRNSLSSSVSFAISSRFMTDFVLSSDSMLSCLMLDLTVVRRFYLLSYRAVLFFHAMTSFASYFFSFLSFWAHSKYFLSCRVVYM